MKLIATTLALTLLSVVGLASAAEASTRYHYGVTKHHTTTHHRHSTTHRKKK